jgi:TPR repeat protein
VRKSSRFIAIALALITADAISGTRYHGGVAFADSPQSEAARVMLLAERGNASAQAQLGWMFSVGRGVPQNYLLAAKWYRRAAEQGNGDAQFALGLLYNKGEGVPQDFVLAYMWFNLSASQAVGKDRDFKVRIRDGVATKMTIAQVEAAQQMARAWYNLP